MFEIFGYITLVISWRSKANKFYLNFSKKIFCYSNEIKNFPSDLKEKIVLIKPLVRKEFYEKNHCGKPNCDSESCLCEKHLGFDSWIEELEQSEQVACNIENQEDCDNCGS